jgi:hypothetical protein
LENLTLFKLTIETDNPAVLAAIANAVNNTPPKGWDGGQPPEVTVHATPEKLREAIDAVNPVEGAVVKPEGVVSPTDKGSAAEAIRDDAVTKAKAKREKAKEKAAQPDPKPEPVDAKDAEERRVILRGLVVRVSKETPKTLKEATETAAKAAGVDTPARLSNCSADAFGKAKAALEALLS